MKISTVSKLDGIRSWSLPAGKTCPGSKMADGTVSLVCQGCYAQGGNYRFKNVKASREHNMKDWKRKNWVRDMVAELDKDKFFRWFDSGDCYCAELAEKIFKVMSLTPHCMHWMSTRMYKLPCVKIWLDAMNMLPNARIRYSADTLDGTFTPGLHGAIVLAHGAKLPKGVKECGAYSGNGEAKCNGCRACWNKSIPVVAYRAHGQKMASVEKRLSAPRERPAWLSAKRERKS